jgi:hypothetical protein
MVARSPGCATAKDGEEADAGDIAVTPGLRLLAKGGYEIFAATVCQTLSGGSRIQPRQEEAHESCGRTRRE